MLYNTQQKNLFGIMDTKREYIELITGEYRFSEAIRMLDKIDWDFKDFKTQYLAHTFHSYPARFIPQIPLAFIRLFTKEKETILDPMCGCGTTLVEAFLNNRIGFLKMPEVIEKCMESVGFIKNPSFEEYIETDLEAREQASRLITDLNKTIYKKGRS